MNTTQAAKLAAQARRNGADATKSTKTRKAAPKRPKTAITSILPAPSEAQIQHLVVSWLRLNGYVCMETGKWETKGRNTIGTPDLFIWHPSWSRIPGRGWQAVEMKTAKGPVRPEQQELVRMGASVICRSLEEVMEVVKR